MDYSKFLSAGSFSSVEPNVRKRAYDASINGTVLQIVAVLMRRPWRRRWRLWTVLLRGVRSAAMRSKCSDAVGASPVGRLRAHVGTDAGDAAASTAGTAAAAAAGSRARRTLTAVQA